MQPHQTIRVQPLEFRYFKELFEGNPNELIGKG